MGAEPNNINNHHDDFHTEKINKRRRRAACCVRVVSALVFLKLVFTVGTFAFLSLRSAHPISLAPFESHEVRFCPSWFRAVDVVAPFPASEWVTVHKFKGTPNVTEEAETYNVAYNVDLRGGQFGRTHTRRFYFPAGTTFDLEFDASAPINFMILHPEHRRERHNLPRGEGNSHGHRQNENEGPASGHRAGNHHEAVVKKQFRVSVSGGHYDMIVSLPRNHTTETRVTVRIAASVKTLDISHSCPIRSSLTRGYRHVRLQNHVREHVVLAASPYARTSSLVYVHLVPREHKFAVVSAVLFGVWAVLRLLARYLRAHSGVKSGKGKCFWSRLCKRNNSNVQYSPILQVEPQIQVVYPGQN